MFVSIRKQIRAVVLGIAISTLALAPTAALAAAPAAQPAAADAGLFVTTWSWLVDLGERLASAVGLSSSSDESPASSDPTFGLPPDSGETTQCTADCTDGDSGPTMDPNG